MLSLLGLSYLRTSNSMEIRLLTRMTISDECTIWIVAEVNIKHRHLLAVKVFMFAAL